MTSPLSTFFSDQSRQQFSRRIRPAHFLPQKNAKNTKRQKVITSMRSRRSFAAINFGCRPAAHRYQALGVRVEQEQTEKTEIRDFLFRFFRLLLFPSAQGNAKGVAAHSPRLARQRLPWEYESRILNANGVVAGVGRIIGNGRRNRVAVGNYLADNPPRVARSSQPLGWKPERRRRSSHREFREKTEISFSVSSPPSAVTSTLRGSATAEDGQHRPRGCIVLLRRTGVYSCSVVSA